MRNKENIEQFVRFRKPRVTTSRRMDERTLNDSFAAMERTIRTKSADHKLGVTRIIFQNRMIKFAVAAVIIVGIGLFSVRIHQGTSEKSDAINVSEIAKSPVEMVTAMSLERAFRRGGIEAVEEQCKQAFQPRGLQPGNLSVNQILAEFNGNGKSSERTLGISTAPEIL